MPRPKDPAEIGNYGAPANVAAALINLRALPYDAVDLEPVETPTERRRREAQARGKDRMPVCGRPGCDRVIYSPALWKRPTAEAHPNETWCGLCRLEAWRASASA